MTVETDLAGQLKVITEYAPRLRAAGVQHLSVGEISIALAPPDPVAPDVTAAAPPKAMLDDPETYGLPDGASPPGFTRPDDL